MKQTRVNIASVVNAAAIRREVRNGRNVIVVPSATLPDNVVMNDILYPAEEIEKSYKTLERTPAPFGHPRVNGKYVPASDPEAINVHYIGAWNENVKRKDGRVFLDKVIDVEVASLSVNGRAVLDAIDKGSPIHTSTGLVCNLTDGPADKKAKHTAINMLFDHDAILLGEAGAATPEQGVGMLVNGEEIEVVNSVATEAMKDLEWAAQSAVAAMEKMGKAPLIDRVVSAIMGAITLEQKTTVNQQEQDMADEKKLDELSNQVKGMEAAISNIGTSVAEAVTNALKPITEQLTAVTNAQKAKDEEELAGLREKIVKANIMTESEAKELTMNVAKKLAATIVTPGRSPVLATNNGTDTNEWSGYNVNEFMKDEKGAA